MTASFKNERDSQDQEDQASETVDWYRLLSVCPDGARWHLETTYNMSTEFLPDPLAFRSDVVYRLQVERRLSKFEAMELVDEAIQFDLLRTVGDGSVLWIHGPLEGSR